MDSRVKQLTQPWYIHILLYLLVISSYSLFVLGNSHLFAAEITPPPTINITTQQLLDKSKSNNSLHVIATLNIDYKPEGKIKDPQQIMKQRGTIHSQQQNLLNDLPEKTSTSAKLFTYTPQVALTVDEQTLKTLIEDPSIISIQEDIPVPPLLADSTPLINADNVWTSGYTGSGQTVAILDTGVDYAHEFLSEKMVSEACYSSGTSLCPNGLSVDETAGSGVNCDLGTYGCDHGTHVAGIAVGNGDTFSGVAKDADLIAIQIFSQFTGSNCTNYGISSPCALTYTSDQILGLERVYELRSTYNIASVNMSIGGSIYGDYCDTDARKSIIDTLRSVEIATVIASGNDGSSTGISSPACISTAISVGSTTKLDSISSFSNSSAQLDLLAPGSSIYSASAESTYTYKSGTSMATPHVAGAWALLKSKFPSASVSTILSALVNSGVSIYDSRNSLTFPRIDLDNALTSINDLAKTWYLAEGYTGEDFSTYILIQNPNASVAHITVNYLVENGSNVTKTYTISAQKRFTINAVNDIGKDLGFSTKIVSDQPLIVERAMYWGTGGHDSIGTTTPALTWYLTEGFTGSDYETYILLQNPNNTVAHCNVQYFLENGPNTQKTHTIPANKRYTVNAVNEIGAGYGFSTKITCDVPVVTERAMYWGDDGHVSIGTPELATTWYLAEGYTGQDFTTYLLIQNPQTNSTTITVNYLVENGDNVSKEYTVDAQKRFTINAINDIGGGKGFATSITSDENIAVERAMYWPGGGHDSVGSTYKSTQWYLAEGYTGEDFSTYILFQNPNPTPVNITVEFMVENGANITKTYSVDANKRFTISAQNEIGSGLGFSTKIDSSQPIVVERAMYWGTGGHCSKGWSL